MAIPAILQMLGGQTGQTTQLSQQIGRIKQMIGMIRSASDPQALLSQMMQQNPGMSQAMDYVRMHGNDPKAAFEALAKERGINPADLGL